MNDITSLIKGDRVLITWCDGETKECTYVALKNGFHVCEDENEKRIVCRLQHVTITKI